jgi:metaxin
MSTSTTDPNRGWLAVPGPLRSLFKLFPLHVYDPEPLPYRSPDPRPSRPALYVFSLPSSGDRGLDQAPSYNPSCLKWQTFLRIAGVDVDLVPSNNHASPSGALPFLLPASDESQTPLTGDKILGFARRHSSYELPAVPNHRLDAYRALIAQSIRPAWVSSTHLLVAAVNTKGEGASS